MAKEREHKIFIVEDDDIYRKIIIKQLQIAFKCKIWSFSNIKDCLGELYQFPDVIILDYMLGDKSGIDSIRDLQYTQQKVPVIILSNQTDIPLAIEIMKEGAIDYVIKDAMAIGRIVENIRKITGK